jgi:hypothetical protein
MYLELDLHACLPRTALDEAVQFPIKAIVETMEMTPQQLKYFLLYDGLMTACKITACSKFNDIAKAHAIIYPDPVHGACLKVFIEETELVYLSLVQGRIRYRLN